MIKTYSYKVDSGTKLSPNFTVSEFACKDGSDIVKADTRLVTVLESIRAQCGGKPVTINSGYRTDTYNTKIGGAKASQHVLGTAADIRISGEKLTDICKAAEQALAELGVKGGIGLYTKSNFVHVDVRAIKSRWQDDGKGQYNVVGWGTIQPEQKKRSTVKKGSKGEDVKELQRKLGGLTCDGVFGDKTDMAVRMFQSRHGLTPDGIVGTKTWEKLEL